MGQVFNVTSFKDKETYNKTKLLEAKIKELEKEY